MSVVLNGSVQPVPLGQGYLVRSPGVRGTADLKQPRTAAERGISRGPDDGTAALDQALAATGVTEVRQVDLRLAPTLPTDAARSLRSTDGQDMLELQVPDLGPEAGQLVLSCDETGVLTWHLPVAEDQSIQTPSTRGGGGAKRFLIPATQPKPSSAHQGEGRSLIGAAGRKLLKVLVYPVTDAVLGPIGEYFAEKWETGHRPYGLRDFSPGSFREPGGSPLGAAEWERLGSGRALLFIHGTFSTAHAAFSQLPDAVFAALHNRYGGRVFAFDHFSISHDPRRNVEWLLGHLPPGRPLELDIICHSRGGLVARTLAERPATFGLPLAAIAVKRIVFVGVPNQGTLLAHPDHMVKMIDRFTTALNLFPTGPVTETLEALITVIKVIGHGALSGLSGLASMRPDGEFLRALNQPSASGSEYYAIAADYTPTDQGLKALVAGRIADSVLDRVFEKTGNDLVVPEPGVYKANGAAGFPISGERLFQVEAQVGMMHTTLFSHPPAAGKLTEWLS